MSTLMRIALREAGTLLLASILLGFAYSFVMKKGFFAITQHTSAPAATVAPEFISYEEAVHLYNAGTALFVDARHEYDYKLGHIKGAVNVPLKDFSLATSALASVPREKLIVTYCDGAECNSSIELAQKLTAAGFTNVKMFFGGWNEWRQHHGEVE